MVILNYTYFPLNTNMMPYSLDRVTVDKIVVAINNCDISSDFILQFMSYIQLNAMRPATTNQVLISS